MIFALKNFTKRIFFWYRWKIASAKLLARIWAQFEFIFYVSRCDCSSRIIFTNIMEVSFLVGFFYSFSWRSYMGVQMFARVICIDSHLILRSKCTRVELRAIFVIVNENLQHATPRTARQTSVCPTNIDKWKAFELRV